MPRPVSTPEERARTIRRAHTAHLTSEELRRVRALLDAAFGGDFSDADWEHALGGVHILALDGAEVVGHAAIVQRRLVQGDLALRTGYVEGVADDQRIFYTYTPRGELSTQRLQKRPSGSWVSEQSYDYKSRLAAYRYYDGAASASKATDYTYDPLDRPIKQVETISGQTTSYDFTYVGVTNALSKEVVSGASNTTKRYAYDVFGQRSTIAEGSNRYSYLYDPHTSVSLLIDQQNQVKESYGYTAYGAANAALTKTAAGFNPKTNPYRYTGKRLDSGSGTYDMGARRYSAATGRFLQVDLYYDALDNLGLSQDPLTQNRYALAGGNPINFVEVDGHFSIRVCSFIPKSSGLFG